MNKSQIMAAGRSGTIRVEPSHNNCTNCTECGGCMDCHFSQKQIKKRYVVCNVQLTKKEYEDWASR